MVKKTIELDRTISTAPGRTQEFFVRVMEGRYLDRADPDKDRFRAFILTSMKFFLADEADRSRAQKRGGGKVVPGAARQCARFRRS